MGRITIFIADGCTASNRTMAALTGRKLPYTVINISDHPSKRSDMLKLCNRYSTPNVFFNTRYIGGCEATINLLNEWALNCEEINENGSTTCSSTVSSDDRRVKGKEKGIKFKSNPTLYSSMYERYVAEIGNHHDPSDPRLSVPQKKRTLSTDDVDLLTAFTRDKNQEYCITLPNDNDRSTILEMTVMLIDVLRHVDHTGGSITYKQSFNGGELIKALSAVFEISMNQALKFASALFSKGIFNVLWTASLEGKDTDVNSQSIYRMKCYEQPNVLNSFCDWNEKVDTNCIRLIHRLTNILNSIHIDATDRNGTMRRERAIKHTNFPMFEEALCELQGVHLSHMNDCTKIAFGINLYNLMIQYAILKIGFVDLKSKTSRSEYFTLIKFNVGGYLYSLYEWEHGILRGNSKGSSCDGIMPTSIPFGRKDPRITFVVKKPDPRVHFAIYHGTNCCPNIRRYSASNLDEELTIATKSFCENEKNVKFEESKNELHVSKIFTWYRIDFGNDLKILPHWICSFTHGSIKQKLEYALDNKAGGKPIKIVEIASDWSMKPKWIYGTLNFDSESFKMNKGRGHITTFLPKVSSHKSRELRVEL